MVAIPIVVAGCAGSPAPPGTGDDPAPDIFRYSDYLQQMGTLHTTWDGIGITDPATLTIGGNASFDGVMGLRLQVGSTELLVNGDLGIDVSFSTNSLTGDVRNFMDENENVLGGTLAVTGGVLDRAADLATEFTFSANIGGTLTGASEIYAITGDLQGDFKGTSAGAIAGIVAGTTNGTGFVFGEFIAEQ